MSSKKVIDWEAIEREYRVGQLSMRALATKHGTTAGAISKKATANDWVKDASQEVRERTRAALLTQHRVDAEETGDGNSVSLAGNAPTHADIEVAVQTNLQVITRHRKDIHQGQQAVKMLLGQLLTAADTRDELEEAIDTETEDDSNGRRRSSMLKAVSLPTHAGVIRDLSTAMKNLVALERQAFNLDDVHSEETYEERLARLMGGAE